MREILDGLAEVIRELSADSRLALNSNDEGLDDEGRADAGDLPEMFEQLYGYPCPETLKAGLYLPDTLSADWKLDDIVSGEFSLSNIFLTIHRTLDESLHQWTLKDISLSETRFVDAVVLHGGPIYALIVLTGEGISEQLYLFDTREMFELELSYEEYLRTLILTKGIIYWQYLFCRERRLAAFEKSVLDKEITFLQTTFPNRDYQQLTAKLTEKSS
jgi:hypothetical protein